MRATTIRYCVALVSCFTIPLVSEAANVKRVEQGDPSITYTGTWHSNNAAPNSGGTAALSNSADAQATISFAGSGITWIGVKDPGNGLAKVTLDGAQHTVDTYAATTLYQQPLFSANGLAPGKHTLTIQVLSRQSSHATGSWVWVDAFDIDQGEEFRGREDVKGREDRGREQVKTRAVASPGWVQQDNAAITYAGKWFPITNPAMSGGTAVEATDVPASATLTFAGDGVQWIAYRDSDAGIAKVYIDGSQVATVDTYSPTNMSQAVMYSADHLPRSNDGTHTITIAVTGTHNTSSHGAWIWVDAFQVVGRR
jgi:hypothetical protein